MRTSRRSKYSSIWEPWQPKVLWVIAEAKLKISLLPFRLQEIHSMASWWRSSSIWSLISKMALWMCELFVTTGKEPLKIYKSLKISIQNLNRTLIASDFSAHAKSRWWRGNYRDIVKLCAYILHVYVHSQRKTPLCAVFLSLKWRLLW